MCLNTSGTCDPNALHCLVCLSVRHPVIWLSVIFCSVAFLFVVRFLHESSLKVLFRRRKAISEGGPEADEIKQENKQLEEDEEEYDEAIEDVINDAAGNAVGFLISKILVFLVLGFTMSIQQPHLNLQYATTSPILIPDLFLQ